MADANPSLWTRLSSDPKTLVTLIAALTALVTSVTSLVKALDKSVEQTSYETLSQHITELQTDNDKLHKSLDDTRDMLINLEHPDPPPPALSASVAAPVASAPVTVHVHGTPPVRVKMAPPPSWDKVMSQASRK